METKTLLPPPNSVDFYDNNKSVDLYNNDNCAICMEPLNISPVKEKEKEQTEQTEQTPPAKKQTEQKEQTEQKIIYLSSCKHTFHLSCIQEWSIVTRGYNTCPLCRTKFKCAWLEGKTKKKNYNPNVSIFESLDLPAEENNIVDTVYGSNTMHILTHAEWLRYSGTSNTPENQLVRERMEGPIPCIQCNQPTLDLTGICSRHFR